MTITDAELDAYASVVAQVAEGASQSDALAAAGLDDERFASLEKAVDAETSRALDAPGDAVPEFLTRLDRAVARAQAEARKGKPPMPFEQLTRVLGAIASGREPAKELERLGVDPRELSRAISAYAADLARDPARAKALADAIGPKKRSPGSGKG
ncbi:MAG TPA: hypothetical protein VL400_10955 [Polyangiaceae bacterium]|jgi:hypothetical protein|nr:hypothetical protein [Polyangiaceae bacterium]